MNWCMNILVNKLASSVEKQQQQTNCHDKLNMQIIKPLCILILTFIMYIIQRLMFQSLIFIILSFLADDRFIPYQVSIILS